MEIIKREIIDKSQESEIMRITKQQIEGDLQVSVNSHGRLVLRFYNSEGDTLICLDGRESSDLKFFIKKDDLPF